uniref:Serpentine Receptor, class T n=1 Tax=Steinernema glaseri TaxID=37863 RepID=A0A1I8ATI6_9BILA
MLSYDEANTVVYYTLSGASILFAIPFFYIMMFHSPSTIRLYRNTILNLTIWYYLAVLINGIFLQFLFTIHGDQLCAKYVGLASYFGPAGVFVCLFLCMISCTNAGVSMFICFIFRYVQISNHTLPAYFLWFRPTTMCVILHVTSSIVAGLMTYVFLSTAYIFEIHGILYACFDEKNYSTIKTVSSAIVGGVALATVLIFCLVFMSIKALRSAKAFMTKQTYRLQLLLTTNLVVLAVSPIVFTVVPITSNWLCVYFRSDIAQFSLTFAAQVPFLDVVSMCWITVAFVTPYREAVRKFFCKKLTVAPIAQQALTVA